MTDAEQTAPDESRRDFLKYAATASAALAVVGVGAMAKSVVNGPSTPPVGTPTTFPKILITNISSLKDNVPVTFNYPLGNEPSLLVKVGQKAEGGIGPNNDIVAFSNICQHLGCIYGFQPPGTSPPCNSSYTAKIPMGYCCCHGSQYDFLQGAKVIGGPAPRPVPAVKIELDSSTGDIYAVGMDPPVIYGHGTPGSTNVETDLQGGTLVSTSSSAGAQG